MTARIEHVALLTDDLERSRRFYVDHLEGRASDPYRNAATGFTSYFLEFDAGPRLELMQMPGVAARTGERREFGLVHVAFSLGSETAVDDKTDELARAGYAVLDGPRRTGDGYYESVILDPDGNRVELTV